MMEDSKKERNRNIRTLIIGILVLLACVIGAAYAYFLAPSTNNSETNIITSTLEENGVVSLTNPVDNIHIEIQPRDMNESKKGTTYYGTVDPNKQYETEETYHEIAKATVTGGSDNTEYTCKFNLKTTISGTMKDKLKEGDMSITFSGAYTGTYDLTELTETREVTINLSGQTREQSVLAKIEFNNRDAHQRYIAGNTLYVEINNESFSCGGSDIQRILEWAFDYTGSAQEFTVPYTGTYNIELWGAQGGNFNDIEIGGYGAYSTGFINLSKNNRLYVNVGGAGLKNESDSSSYIDGGYNGGGAGGATSGGGATHIAIKTGLLNILESEKDKIIIVSGGGGAASNMTANTSFGGHGGGYIGNTGAKVSWGSDSTPGIGGSQTSGGLYGKCANGATQCGNYGSFGKGGDYFVCNTSNCLISPQAGGGGGYYGGGSARHNGAGGGSGYIGNSNLTNKHMTCYNCATSDVESTKTISNTCVDANPVVDCSKTGNGYVKITYLGKPYKEEILNGADPVYNSNLIPVTIAANGEVRKADITKEWYSYEKTNWANAVMLTDNTTYDNGNLIPEANIKGYFVWIPKYQYQLFDMGNYNGLTGTSTTGNAKEIQIKFGLENTTDSDKECVTPMTSGGSGTCEVGKWMTHPAFISMNSNGIWVAKFETTGSANNISSKPNLTSLGNQNIKTQFEQAYNFSRNNDSHMMKNTEWGAVAYLSHSIYGINGEVYINNVSTLTTGCGGDTPSEERSSTCKNAFGTKTNGIYNQSTTGNISGVFDMSGGAYEYVSGYLNNVFNNSGFNASTISNYDPKYFDVYSISNTNVSTNYDRRILGDATGEMGPFMNDRSGWYEDSALFIYSNAPWFVRGYGYTGVTSSGIFSFYIGGGVTAYNSFRIVLTN